MYIEQIIKMVAVIILALIAVGAIWYGGRKKKRNLYTTGFGLLLISIILFFVYFREYAPIFSAWAAVAIAIAAFAVIEENRRLREQSRLDREEEKERDSKRRRLEEMQHWINEVLRIKSESGGEPGTDADIRRRAAEARTVASVKQYIRIEAGRLDSEFEPETKLTNLIDRLTFLLEHHTSDLGADRIQQELEEKCNDALKVISNIKAELKL